MAEQRCPACGVSKIEFARNAHSAMSTERVGDDVLELIARNEPATRRMTPDRDAADRIARFVASWAFPLAVLTLIVVWLLVNVTLRPFEPFPILFLAVVSATLASLGALQGPIILRVQRRQRQRDHDRDETDHRVNLRAELEIRWLDHKLDHLLELHDSAARASGADRRPAPDER